MEFARRGKAALLTAESKAGPLATHMIVGDEAAEAVAGESPVMDPLQPNYFPMAVRADSAADSTETSPFPPSYFQMMLQATDSHADAPHALHGVAVVRAGSRRESIFARGRAEGAPLESRETARCQPNYFLMVALWAEWRVEEQRRSLQDQSNLFLFAAVIVVSHELSVWQLAGELAQLAWQPAQPEPFAGRTCCKRRRGPDFGFRSFRKTYPPLSTS
jgi:hypothetical protein